MIHTFRDPRPKLPCAKCDLPLEGIPMDAGDFLYVHGDEHEPAPAAFHNEKRETE